MVYGKLGIDVGLVGRWSRLLLGLIYLLPLLYGFAVSEIIETFDIGFWIETTTYFAVILMAYVAVYYALGQTVFNRGHGWLNTLILVGPALVIVSWSFTVAPLVGITLPFRLTAAMGLYVGLSLVLQWRIKYGGCEVVSIPILLLRKRYPTYCIPIVVLDATEKAFVDRKAK